MSRCVLFIDGENFLHKVEDVLKDEGINKSRIDLASIDLIRLFEEPLKRFTVSKKVFDLIKENNLYEQFYDRCRKVVDDTKGMGWGFHDGLEYVFRRFYQSKQ